MNGDVNDGQGIVERARSGVINNVVKLAFRK